MSKFHSRMHVLSSYLEVVKRELRREHSYSYGRNDFYRKFWHLAADSIGADIETVGEELFRISRAGRHTFVKLNYLNIDSYFNRLLVDDKPAICEILSREGFATPKYITFDIRSIDMATRFLEAEQCTFVVKPCRGGGGEGITTGIDSYDRLKKASIRAAAFFSENLMLEEQFPGDSYRLLFLDGELIDVVQRRRPTVTGDGKSSIRQLINAENDLRRERDSNRSLFELRIDLDCEYFLTDHGLNLDSVPEAHKKTAVKNVANENARHDNSSVLDIVNAEYRSIGRKISAMLGINLVGIDIMTTDISVPLDQSGGMINEINIPPGFHYHEMIDNSDRSIDVGPRVLEFVLGGHGIQTWLFPISSENAKI